MHFPLACARFHRMSRPWRGTTLNKRNSGPVERSPHRNHDKQEILRSWSRLDAVAGDHSDARCDGSVSAQRLQRQRKMRNAVRQQLRNRDRDGCEQGVVAVNVDLAPSHTWARTGLTTFSFTLDPTLAGTPSLSQVTETNWTPVLLTDLNNDGMGVQQYGLDFTGANDSVSADLDFQLDARGADGGLFCTGWRGGGYRSQVLLPCGHLHGQRWSVL